MAQTLTHTAKMRAIRVKAANKHIFHALLTLASAALLTRMFGMLNQVIVTSRFGAGGVMDGYFVAYSAPSLIALLFISAIEASVTPVYTRVRSQGNKEQISRLFSTVVNLFLAITILLTIIMLLFRQQLILLSAPGLDYARLELASSLAPFIYPAVVLMTMVGLLECIFNAEGQFGWPAYAGLLVPVTTVVLVLLVGNSQGVVVLCVGMLAGLCLQLCVFIVRARRAKLVYRPIMDVSMPEMRTIFAAAWPALLGIIIAQGSPFIDQIFASSLSSGSISALNYSLKITAVFSGVIFASVGRAILPYLSQSVAQKDMKAFKQTLRLYAWIVGVGTGMLSILVIALAHPIVQILFQRGAFSSADTNRASAALIGFTIGLTPMSLGFIAARAFSALGKTKVFIGVGSFTVLADAVFDFTFAHFWQSQGIALATSAVYCCTMIINLFVLSRIIGKLDLLTPPAELFQLVNRITVSLSPLFAYLKQKILISGIAVVVFIAGTMGSILNAAYTLRIALFSVMIVALLRYRYALLLTWVVFDVFNGSIIAIFNGNNIDTALTIPTLILLAFVPVKQAFKRMPALVFLLLYLLWIFIGIENSTTSLSAFLINWGILLDFLAVAVLAILFLATRTRLLQIIDFILIPATFVALYGIYSYIVKQHGIFDPMTSLFRSYSIFTSAPTPALFFSIIIPVAIYRVTTLHGLRRLGLIILVLLFLLAVGVTFTRSAFISLPLSIFVIVFFLPSSRLKVGMFSSSIASIAIILFLSAIGNIPLLSRFLNVQNISTFDERTYLWQALFSHFDPAKVLGNGYGASYALILNLGLRGIGSSSSNLFIGTLYDYGIIGLFLLVLLFSALFIGLMNGIRRTKGEHRILFAVTLAVLINVFFQSFNENDLWNQAIGLYFWLIMSLPFALYWKIPQQSRLTSDEMIDYPIQPQLEVAQRDAVKASSYH